MIISDNENHKIDATFNPDGWLQLTIFYRKGGRTGTDWTGRTVGLSPLVQDALVEMIRIARKEAEAAE